MGLNRNIQKLFIRLSNSHINKWRGNKHKKFRKRTRNKWSYVRSNFVTVKIVNAVTGEVTTAKINEDSELRLKKWLRLRNMRAQFSEMLLKKDSTWLKLTPNQWKDFPVIVKIGTTQFPYVVEYIGEKITLKNKTFCSIFLKTVDNIEYLTVIGQKEKEIVSILPVKKVKKK